MNNLLNLQESALLRFCQILNKKNSMQIPYFSFAGNSGVLYLATVHQKSIIVENIRDVEYIKVNYAGEDKIFYGIEVEYRTLLFKNRKKKTIMHFPSKESKDHLINILEKK